MAGTASSRWEVTAGSHELDLADGRTERRWQLTNDPTHNYDYGALLLADGTLYVPFAGNCDKDPYHGMVAAIRVSDGRRIATWFPDAGPGGGGLWGYGGVSADPAGSIFAADRQLAGSHADCRLRRARRPSDFMISAS